MDDREPAPLFERAGAFAIEGAICGQVCGVLIQVLLAAPSAVFGPAFALPWRWAFTVPLLLVAALLAWTYRWKRSPGMAAVGLELLDTKNGARPRLWQCMVRAVLIVLGAALSAVAVTVFFVAGAPDGPGLGLGWWLWGPWLALCGYLLSYLPMRFTPRHQSLWDLLTRTAVVKRETQTFPAPVSSTPR